MWGSTPDPDWSLLISTSSMLGAYNLTGYSNPEYDKLWTQQTSEMDAAKRKAIIDQMSTLLVKDQVVMPIATSRRSPRGTSSGRASPTAAAPFGFYSYLNKTQFNALAVQK